MILFLKKYDEKPYFLSILSLYQDDLIISVFFRVCLVLIF